MTAELQIDKDGYVTGVVVGKFQIKLEHFEETNKKLRDLITGRSSDLPVIHFPDLPVIAEINHFAVENEVHRRLQEVQRANDQIVDGVLELIMKHGRMPVAIA